MLLTDFDFELPPELIAQQPAEQRDGSRLMHIERSSGTIESGLFANIDSYFRAGDLLVVNDTRVIPARLIGRKSTGGRVEVFLVRPCSGDVGQLEWLCLTKSSRPVKSGTLVEFADGFGAEILERSEDPYRRVRFSCQGELMTAVEAYGHLPLPPYIKRADESSDRERYQTVFAREQGAVAAPTAGLHFTDDVLARLRSKGVEIQPLTLHVGLGTFLPVRVENIRDHRMHGERYSVPAVTADAVNLARHEGRRIVALGTTSARTLETAASADGTLLAGSGESEIFIYPGYRFKLVDALVTNFHLPQSTLLMLVSALAGRDLILTAYQRAVAERYRFFSYGDCMMIA